MKLTDRSLSLLKTMSRVTKSIVLKKGKIQRAAGRESNVIVEVILDDEIPVNFGIFDITKLINLLSAMKDADLEFNEKYLTITDSTGWKAVFAASAPELISQVETMDAIDNAPVALAFDLQVDTLTKMNKLAKANDLAQISFVDTPQGIIMRAFNAKVKDSNIITVPLTKEDKDDSLCVKTPFTATTLNMDIELDSYRVILAELGFAKFESKSGHTRYIVLTEMETK